MTEQMLGFIGLGNMGGPMAANLAAVGNALICYDASGTAERAPEGAAYAASAAEVAHFVPTNSDIDCAQVCTQATPPASFWLK